MTTTTKKPYDDDFVQLSLSGAELIEVVQALLAESETLDRNRAVALRMNRHRLADHYTLWQHIARSALERCRYSLQCAEDAAELPEGKRYTPASGPDRCDPEQVASRRRIFKALVVDYAKHYGDLKGALRPPQAAVTAAQKELELLEPEGSC